MASPSESARPPHSTLEEVVDRPARTTALLTYVLGYDDLLADEACCLPLDDGAAEITIGRDEVACVMAFRSPDKIGLRDRWSSSRHALFRRSGGACLLADKGSKNGTFVNGLRIHEQRLWNGDLIEMGHSLLCYREVAADLAPRLISQPPRLGPTLTRSPELAVLAADIARIAPSDEPVLLLGETGTGKEIVAAAIHTASGRQGQLVAVDCGAVPETLFESTFFGHQRGAFTGAAEARIGEMVRADRGTLFLDEVANMGMAQQAKLLRALEDGKITPLGAAVSQQLDVRWVAATNRDVFAESSGFRPDLLRRLAGYVARLPPLRRRREDLGTLTAYLLRQAGVERAAITAPAGRRLFSDPFAGNVRQLRTTLRSAAVLAGAAPIDVAQLAAPSTVAADPFSFHSAVEPAAPVVAAVARGATRRPVSAAELKAALRHTSGNVVQAAKALGAHPRQLYRWIQRYQIDLDAFRNESDLGS